MNIETTGATQSNKRLKLGRMPIQLHDNMNVLISVLCNLAKFSNSASRL